MTRDLIIIKKKYGEEMSHLCRDLFPTILEEPGKLSQIMLNYFMPNKELYKDIINNDAIQSFKLFIYSKYNIKDSLIDTGKSPEELLSEVNYTLYECHNDLELQTFRKYYAINEELCSFWLDRTKDNYVFFAIKNNVSEIKREDFINPLRQDEYGTSVISIQFTKDDTHTLSIKNRYNHSVMNPNATFSNFLDNIIPGLTKAFENYYGLKQKNILNYVFTLDGYVKDNNGMFYKNNITINNINYCDKNVILTNDKTIKLDREKYIVFDYFILDLQNKKIFLLDNTIEDSFIDTLGIINRIEVDVKDDIKKININSNLTKDKPIVITLKNNKIIKYNNPYIKIINNNFLYRIEYLESLVLENVQEIYDNCLENNLEIKELNISNVKRIGSSSFKNRNKLKELYLPKLEELKGHNFIESPLLEDIILPNIITIGECSFCKINNVKKINLNNVEVISHNCFCECKNLEDINISNVKHIGYRFLLTENKLTTLDMNNLISIGDYSLCNTEIDNININNIREIGNFVLMNNHNIKEFIAPLLEKLGINVLLNDKMLQKVYLPNLQDYLEHSKLALMRK